MKTTSGQTIAMGRFVLASIFLLAIYVDPSQPAAAPLEAYLILVCYVSLALVVLVLTWRNWWLDHVLAPPLHCADLALFGVVVFATEGYTSPFFTFSVFLLLSSIIRWGWREAAYTAVAVNGLFVTAGLLSAFFTPAEVEIQRLLIRATYLLVLSALFVLYAHRSEAYANSPVTPSQLDMVAELPRLMELVIEDVRQQTDAGKVLIIWHDEDEPQSFTFALKNAEVERRELAPGKLTGLLAASARMHNLSTQDRKPKVRTQDIWT